MLGGGWNIWPLKMIFLIREYAEIGTRLVNFETRETSLMTSYTGRKNLTNNTVSHTRRAKDRPVVCFHRNSQGLKLHATVEQES